MPHAIAAEALPTDVARVASCCWEVRRGPAALHSDGTRGLRGEKEEVGGAGLNDGIAGGWKREVARSLAAVADI
eukprot:768058-Hanusia_phi.AAC.11